MAIKVYGGNHGIATANVISDNTSEALDIESTDGAEYVKIDTTNSNEKLILGDGLPATGAVCIGTDDNKLSSTLQQLTIGHPDGSSKVRVHVQGTNNGALMTMNCGTGAQNAEIDFRDGEGGARWVLGKQGSNKLFRIIGSTGASGSGTCITGQYETGFWSVTPDGTGPTAAHAWHVQDGDLGVVTNSADAVAKSLVFTKSRNATDGNATIVNNNDVLGRIDWYAADASSGTTADNQTISASIYSQIDGTPGDGAMPGSIRFATTPDGASSLTDRFVIRQNGNVGIGDTEPNYRAVIGGGKSGPIIYNYNSNTSGISSAITAAPNGAAGMIIDHRVTDSLYVMNTTSTNAANSRSTGIAFFGRVDGGSDGDPNAGAADSYPMMGALRVKHEGSAEDQKGYMAFYTNDGTDDRVPTERMRITSDGKIGIADSAPLYKFTVKASSTHEDVFLIRTSTSKEALRLEVYDNEAGAIRVYGSSTGGDTEQNQHLISGRDGSNGSVEFNIQRHDCDFNYSSENQANMLFIDADTDRVGIATNAPTEALDINSDAIRIRTSQTPASGGTGTAGMICWDANYMYVCTATDTWKRVALTGGY